MSLYASWIHGTSLSVENPENMHRIGYFGWGADMLSLPGKSSWFHVPLPTPVVVGGIQSKLLRVFLLFETERGNIRRVHIFDGTKRVQEFNDLNLTGKHSGGVDSVNTFKLKAPHSVFLGIGISFLFVGEIGFDTPIPPPRLVIASAGGDYDA